jgi:hypothetical protein
VARQRQVRRLAADIASIRLSYRPMSMQARRFRADIEKVGGGRIAIPRPPADGHADGAADQAIRLHHRASSPDAAGRQQGRLIGGIGPKTCSSAGDAAAGRGDAGALRALTTSEFAGALFLVGIMAWFVWQVGGFIRRNRPCRYSFDALPDALLP